MMLTPKLLDYRRLVEQRKTCRECRELTNPSACAGGLHDRDHLGPWSRWQGSLDAEVMVIGQDWGDDKYFKDNDGYDNPENPTNATLRMLLDSIGLKIDSPLSTDDGGGTLFFTNAILCLKQGGMQSKVQPAWFRNCAPRFLRPTIELVQPKIVITLGGHAYRAVSRSYDQKVLNFRQAVEHQPGFLLRPDTWNFPVYHCGKKTININRSLDWQLADWARIGRAIRDQSMGVGRTT